MSTSVAATGGGAGAAAPLRPFRAGLVFSFFNAVNWQIALGTPMVLFVGALGGSTFETGLAYSFVLMLVPVQVLATPLLARWGFRRTVLSGWTARAFFLLPPIGIAAWAHVHGPARWMVVVMLASLFCFTLLRAMASGAWVPWLYSILPPSVRGRYFANDQVLGGIAGVAVVLLSAAVFRVLSTWVAFGAAYVVALAGAAVSVWALRAMPDGPRPQTLRLMDALRETPRLCTRPGPFRAFLILSCVNAAATSGMTPFCAYFLQNEVRVDSDAILLFEVMRITGVVVGSLALRGSIDQTGPRAYFVVAALFQGLVVLFWVPFVLVGGGGEGLLHLVYLFLGMGSAAWVAANLSYLAEVVPEENRTLALAVHGAVVAFVGGVSVTVWGAVLRDVEGGRAAMNEVWFVVFLVFVAASLAAIVAGVRRLPFSEKHVPAIDLGAVVQRPQRAMSFLVHLVDQRIGPRPGNGGGGR